MVSLLDRRLHIRLGQWRVASWDGEESCAGQRGSALRFASSLDRKSRGAQSPHATAPCAKILLFGGRGRWVRGAALDFGADGDGTGAVFADGADGEEVVVGGDGFQNRLAGCGREIIDVPARHSRSNGVQPSVPTSLGVTRQRRRGEPNDRARICGHAPRPSLSRAVQREGS